MSHFAVAVITNEQPTADVLHQALLPFHEFECTGFEDFVQDIDQTEEVLNDYNTSTDSVIEIEGKLISKYDDRFYRLPNEEEQKILGSSGLPHGTGSGSGLSWHSKDWNNDGNYHTRIHDVSAYVVKEVPLQQTTSFKEWLEDYHGKHTVPFGELPDLEGEHKYGYALLNEDGSVNKVIDRTNPNKKWDWYTVGGRYSGKLRILFQEGEFDSCQVSEIDFNAIKAVQEKYREERWEKANEIWLKFVSIGTPSDADSSYIPDGVNSLEDALQKWNDLNKQYAEEFGDEAISKLRAIPELEPFCKVMIEIVHSYFGPQLGMGFTTRQQFVSATMGLTTYAFLLPATPEHPLGQWIENGEMGWWGVSHGAEMTEQQWADACKNIFNSLKPEQFITFIDCHI